MTLGRRRLVRIVPLLLAASGCALTQGGPTESENLGSLVKAALPADNNDLRMLRRAEWGMGRTRVMGFYNSFSPIHSEHSPKVGVMAATNMSLFFCGWEDGSERYKIGRQWPYAQLLQASLTRFGASRWIVLRDKNDLVDAFWLMKNRYVQDTEATEMLQRFIASRAGIPSLGAVNS